MTKTALQQLIERLWTTTRIHKIETGVSRSYVDIEDVILLIKESLPTEKQQMEDFAKWYSNLLPTQKCTIHPPAGSGAGFGLYEKSMSDLFDKYLNEHNNG